MAIKSITGSTDDILAGKWTGFGRRFIYKPASLWLSWVFIASATGVAFFFVFLYQMWATLKPSQAILLTLAPYVLGVLIPLAFFIAYAGLQYTVARGFFAVLGDASISNVSQLTPLGVLVTKDEYDSVEDPELSKDVAFEGKTIVRNKVNMWGRLGGVKNWPGWDGGKRDGFYNVVYDFWDEVEGKVIHIKRTCPTCGGEGKVERGHYYTPAELELLSRATPGWRLGTTMVLPYEAWPVDFDEIPEEIALAIRSDPEWRQFSRIWTMEDQLPSKTSLGSSTPSNTLVRLWGAERTNRILRDRTLELTMQLAMVRGMSEEGISGGPPSLGPGLGSGRQ